MVGKIYTYGKFICESRTRIELNYEYLPLNEIKMYFTIIVQILRYKIVIFL